MRRALVELLKENLLLIVMLTLPALLSGKGGGARLGGASGGLLFGLFAGAPVPALPAHAASSRTRAPPRRHIPSPPRPSAPAWRAPGEGAVADPGDAGGGDLGGGRRAGPGHEIHRQRRGRAELLEQGEIGEAGREEAAGAGVGIGFGRSSAASTLAASCVAAPEEDVGAGVDEEIRADGRRAAAIRAACLGHVVQALAADDLVLEIAADRAGRGEPGPGSRRRSSGATA